MINYHHTMEGLYSCLITFLSSSHLELFNMIVTESRPHIRVEIEDIYQPPNAHVLLHSSDCFGDQYVYVVENENTYELSKWISLGSNKWLSMHDHNRKTHNSVSYLKQCRQEGYQVIARTPLEESTMIQLLAISASLAFVLGNELDRISEEVKHYADGFVKIPMYGFTESFNFSVAALIRHNELCDQLGEEVSNWQLSEQGQVKPEWAKYSIPQSDLLIRWFKQGQA